MHSKIFTACFLGAFIGTIVALQVHPYLWWLGLVVGSLVGYLSFEFKSLLAAVPKAWGRTRKGVTWNGFIRYFDRVGIAFAFYSPALLPILGLSLILAYREAPLVWVLAISAGGIGFLAFMSLLMGWALMPCLEEKLAPIRRINAFTVYFHYLPQALRRWVNVVPSAATKIGVAIGLFLKEFFLLIHSELRLLCACDAAIGAAIGYFAGSALVGGVAGGIFGVLNYEVVSKRLLHLTLRR